MARFTGYGKIGMPTAMRYTGFGQDPNYMYSFRPTGYNPQQSMMVGQDAFRSLRESLAYRQAGMEGKQRMERVVSMGLPANTDINKIQRVGYDPEMRRPVYVAPRPQAWGTYGSVGMNEEERPVTPRMPAGGPQPSQRPTTTGALSFTPFGERVDQEFPPTLAGGLRQWYDEDVPQFPYSY